MADNTTTNAEQTTPPVVQPENNNAPAPDAPDFEQTETGFDAAAAFEKALAEKDEKPKEETPPAAADQKPTDAAKAEEKPKEDAKPDDTGTKPEDVVSDDELQPLPHDKPKTQARIKTLHGKWRTAEEKAVALEAKVKELEEKTKLTPQQTADLESLKKQAEDAKAKAEAAEKLAKETEERYLPYRRQYEIEKSPEIEERFVKPVKAAEETIKATLKGYGLGDATLAEIEKAGGLAAFSKSKKTYQVKDENGDPTTITASQVVNDWLTRMDFADAEKVRSLVGEQEKLNLQRGLYIESEKAKAKEYFDSLTKREQEQLAQQKAAQEAASKEVKEWIDATFANDEDLKDVDGDEKADRAAARERLIQFLSSADRPTLLNAAKKAAAYDLILKRIGSKDAIITQKDARIKELEAEMDKIRSAGAAIPKQSGRTGTGSAGEGKKMDADAEAILRGQLSSADLLARSFGGS